MESLVWKKYNNIVYIYMYIMGDRPSSRTVIVNENIQVRIYYNIICV